MEFMLSEAQRLGFRTLVAILLDCNSASIALLKKYGFSEWGQAAGDCLPVRLLL